MTINTSSIALTALIAAIGSVPFTSPAPAVASPVGARGFKAPLLRGAASIASTRYYGAESVLVPAAKLLLHPPQHRIERRAGPRAFGSWLYTCESGGCNVYTHTPPARTVLSYFETATTGLNFPQGTVARGKGEWYIANTDASNVAVYSSTVDGPHASYTLDDSGQLPGDVDVEVKVDPYITAVSNVYDVGFNTGSVSIYKTISHTPDWYLTMPNPVEGVGIAIDKRGDCFWSYVDSASGVGYIAKFAGCSGSGTPFVTMNFPGGIAFDKHDNMYYVDQTKGVYKCAGLTSCTLLTAGFGDPVFINFDDGWRHLWVTDAVNCTVDALNPNTGAVLAVHSVAGNECDPPIGIALSPGAAY
jgi:hypothetical protein